jgi:chemotaxis protein CheX
LELTGSNGEGYPTFSPGRKVSAAVGITGDWNGAVLLECATGTACLLAGAMLGFDVPEDVNEDVRDVIGEITNMVAGNFKNTLPGNSVLTLPCIIVGSDYSMDIVSGKTVVKESMNCNGKSLMLSVIQESGN